MSISEQLFERASAVMPGGVNSPVRAFGAVGGTPRFIQSAKGSHITDADGNSYLDFVGSWGPMILGHAHPAVTEAVARAAVDGLSYGAATENEVKMAELICRLTKCEMVRMVNSGTEAVMSAIRLARGYTKRSKIIKFEGCYHGHCDSMLVKSGSGLLSYGCASSAGVTDGTASDTLVAQYNDIDSVTCLFEQDTIAAVIVEPVAANMGVVPPSDGFLQGLRQLCDQHGVLLIFDEVITGFRLGLGGAQAYYDIRADLVTYGKIIGGGMPVGCYGGRREIMSMVSPLGGVYQAGTLSGNPLCMAAGLAAFSVLEADTGIYARIDALGERLSNGLSDLGFAVNHVGSLVCIFMTGEQVDSYKTAMTSDTARYAKLHHGLLERGIYVAPAQFEALFLSDAHTVEEIDFTIAQYREILGAMA